MKNSINQLLLAIPIWTEATVAFHKIETMHLAAMEESAATKLPQPEACTEFVVGPHAHLTLSAITHAYTTDMSIDPFTLGPIDLHFTAGELVFITGTNGSGKTTLLKVLAGLYSPEGGTVRWNQVAVTAQNRQSYRELFSVVFSDFHLFEHLLGLEEPTVDEQALHYLSKLQLQSKVTINQGRLSTLDLSQGQRKRLALFTAYLEDRPIYLFDEWAANQDPTFKELFYRELLPELAVRGKLVIAITHDDQYYALADRLLRLENGQLLEERCLPIIRRPQSADGLVYASAGAVDRIRSGVAVY
jgi:putative ATP-binding cassette transporter